MDPKTLAAFALAAVLPKSTSTRVLLGASPLKLEEVSNVSVIQVSSTTPRPEQKGPVLRISAKEASILKKVRTNAELVNLMLNRKDEYGQLPQRILELNSESSIKKAQHEHSVRLNLVRVAEEAKQKAKQKFKDKLAFATIA